jgi:hypothetical protein
MHEGVVVNLKDTLINLNQRHRRALSDRRAAASLYESDGRIAPDSVLELASVDKIVAFFDDRLEARTRLGDAHRVVPYRTVRAVTLEAKAAASISVGDRALFEIANGLESKMLLELASRRRPMVFDFRSEPLDRVQEAVDLIERNVSARRSASLDHDDAPSFLSPLMLSRADEIGKLAALKDAGLLTDEEFATEKARILSS